MKEEGKLLTPFQNVPQNRIPWIKSKKIETCRIIFYLDEYVNGKSLSSKKWKKWFIIVKIK